MARACGCVDVRLAPEDPTLKRRPLTAFLAMSFTGTWGLTALFPLLPSRIGAPVARSAGTHVLWLIAVCAPTISAIGVTFATEGLSGLRRLLARLFRWRAPGRLYAFVLLGVPALGIVAALLGGATPRLGPARILGILPLVLRHALTDPAPLGEELGWRGFALPRLLRQRSALTASLALGAIISLWHLPFHFFPVPADSLPFAAFLVNALSLAVLATWLYQGSQGGVLLPVLLHLLVNVSSTVLGAPLLPFAALLGGAAVAVVATAGPARLG